VSRGVWQRVCSLSGSAKAFPTMQRRQRVNNNK
jgi:hypothetical protein